MLIIFSYLADLTFGDPERLPHPVRGIGKLIDFLDSRLRGKEGKRFERLKGAAAAVIVVGVSALVAYIVLWLSSEIDMLLGELAWIYLGYTTLSVKDLRIKAKAVHAELEKNSVSGAQKKLSKIVGRDTHNLGKPEITRAAIESIAENTNDGIIAPLFYLFLGGPVCAIAYKAVNTLDSMLGYKSDEYRYFGWFSARLDDIANLIPARISGVLIALSAFMIRGKTQSLATMLKYGRKHPSPNSGVPEAAMAGALGIKLGGPSYYNGRLSEKPLIGHGKRTLKPSLINEALLLSLTSSFLMVLIGSLIRWLI